MSKGRLFTCLILLPLLAIAAEDAEQLKPLPTEPLEEYDDPPAPFPLRGTGVSPGMVSEYGPFTSHQVNVNSSGLNITGDAGNEPSISVDPTNHNRMVIGWRQFDSVSSNFRTSGYAYTSNAGSSWTFPGVLEPGVFRSDPVLIADDTGRFLYLSLLETFFDNVWRSVDSGHSWTNLGPATGGDKQWFAIDNNATSTGHGFQHQCWSTAGNNYNGRQYSRSTDGGVTWMNPINIPNSPQWGTPDVDSTGTLFIGGVNVSTNQVWCIRSTNAKNGSVTPTFDQSTAVNLGGRLVSGATINPGGLVGQLFLAADRSGTITNNNIYMLGSVQPTGFSTGSDVMFVRSTNGGASFSTPKRINDDAVNHSKWHWVGTLAVAPNGRIDSVWLDTRNAANNTDSQLVYSFSTDGGTTWSANTVMSQSFNPFLGYPNQNKMGDYITMVSDNTGGDVAYCATFNSEEDIYYIRVSPPGPTPTPSPSPTATPTPSPTPAPTASPSPTSTPLPTASPTSSPSPTPTPALAVTITLPVATVDTATTNFTQPVTASTINASDNLIGFQGDFSFDSTVISFQAPPVSGSGLTANNWTVSGNIIGTGQIRTLRISAFSSDGMTPLSGSGTLFSLNMIRVSGTPGANTALTWAAPPNDFEFIDTDLNLHAPNSTPPGSITVTAPATVSISGSIDYCSNVTLPPVAGVTLTLSGSDSGTSLSDASGNYAFNSLASGGSYVVTPSKPGLAPASNGINTTDVLAVQRHFLSITPIPTGCRLTAADVNGDTNINTTDVIAIQRFFLGFSTGTANVGKYNFNPANRNYSSISSNQTGQNYDALVFGDVASSFVH